MMQEAVGRQAQARIEMVLGGMEPEPGVTRCA